MHESQNLFCGRQIRKVRIIYYIPSNEVCIGISLFVIFYNSLCDDTIAVTSELFHSVRTSL